MIITDAKWSSSDRECVVAMVEGKQTFIPADSGNRHYAEILRQGLAIAEPSSDLPAD